MIQYDDIRVKLNNRRPELAELKDALQLDRAEKRNPGAGAQSGGTRLLGQYGKEPGHPSPHHSAAE